MKQLIIILLVVCNALLAAVPVLADDATVSVASKGIEASDNQITVRVALPENAVGKRLDRVILEVPVTVGGSAGSAFERFPLVELKQSDGEEPKQTTLLPEGFSGIARFDVTRFVRSWSTADAHPFVLGALSEGNYTTLELGTAGRWTGDTKARLLVKYSTRDGVSARTTGAP